jgi:hypothetical protein
MLLLRFFLFLLPTMLCAEMANAQPGHTACILKWREAGSPADYGGFMKGCLPSVPSCTLKWHEAGGYNSADYQAFMKTCLPSASPVAQQPLPSVPSPPAASSQVQCLKVDGTPESCADRQLRLPSAPSPPAASSPPAAAQSIRQVDMILPAGVSQNWNVPRPYKDIVTKGNVAEAIPTGPSEVLIKANPKFSGVAEFLFRDEQGRSIAKLIVTVRGSEAATIRWTYDQLARTPDAYTGSTLTFSGKVLQALQGQGNTILRIAISSDGHSDVMYVEYQAAPSEPRILELDIVDVRGRFVGIKSYTATLGNTIQIPHVIACEVHGTPKSSIQVMRAPQPIVPCEPSGQN